MRDWIRENLPNDEELYAYRTGYLFYFQRKYIVSGAHFGEQLDRWLEKGASYTAEQLQRFNVKWFLFAETIWSNKALEDNSAWKRFKDQYLEETHREGRLILYRFTADHLD